MTRYLARRTGEDGITRMVEVTKEEWRGIVAENAGKPNDQTRKFIPDMINEDGVVDCLVVEASLEDYRKWDAQRQRYNRDYRAKSYAVISLDNIIDVSSGATFSELIPCEGSFEEQVEGQLFLSKLRDVIVQWKFWGPVLLDFYMAGKRRTCTHEFAEMLGISEQMARAYKREFEKFVVDYAAKHSGLQVAA